MISSDIKCKVGCIVIARDEEANIGRCLRSLRNQLLKPYIVVVDDGSIDKTLVIARRFSDYVVSLPRHDESWAGRPELASVFNQGFKVLRDVGVDYVMVSGADAFYPSYYVSKLVRRMNSYNITIASGIAIGERTSFLAVRGSGRIIESNWFKTVGYRYPLNYGFESYIIFRALMDGCKVKVFKDLLFILYRKTSSSPKRAYHWGKAMRALNYWWLFALRRCIDFGFKGFFSMLKGYLSSDVVCYEDLASFVPDFQKRYFVRRILGRFSY
ncbi:MAG: glycosyltransferase family 2 protein [archaeon GB-1867-035]|nr:glycosyltransferase family 2 protein [Candidatus Culexmicrobium profundum]